MNRLFNFLKALEVPNMTMSILILITALFVFIGSSNLRAATFEVNSTIDAIDANPGDGICDDGDGNCTLRAAVMETNDLAGPDEIVLKAKTYLITIPGPDHFAIKGDLDIRDDLLIQGQGAAKTVIDGSNLTRAFELRDDDLMNKVNVEIYDLTIQDCVVGNAGGAIRNHSEKLRLERVELIANFAPRGGGIYNGPNGDTKILNSGIYYNFATDDPGMERGGGIYNDGELFVGNSTISSNTAGDLGGGIFNSGDMHLAFNTVAANITIAGLAGGIHQTAGSTDATLFANLFADNQNGDCAGALVKVESLGYNLAEDDCNLNDPTDEPDTESQIGMLAMNGGGTMTHELFEGSPAIDMAGNDFECFEVGVDQRGVSRPQDGDLIGEANCDAGAFEYIAKPVSDGDSGGGCSLAKSGSASSMSIYLLIPVFLLAVRFLRRYQENV
ncbi:MAG: choice-of-anchor Q domain-containing protein [Thermodesulfobacteriota bacterium]